MRIIMLLVLALVVGIGSACITVVMPGGQQQPGTQKQPDMQKPAAFIDLISPSSGNWGDTVTFTGHGTTGSGSITAYRWRSSVDGDLSARPSFTTSTLSPGKHIILFSVQDSDGNWSQETQGTVNLATQSSPGPGDGSGTPPGDGGGTSPATTPPVIVTFGAAPQTITAGADSTLSWTVNNANVVTIDSGVGSVGLTGTRTVTPASTTTYTLTASNDTYYTQATVTVTVSSAVKKPDLIIEDIWKSGNKVYYRIRNQGTEASPATTSRLTVDGVVKATDSVAALAAGTGSTQYFSGYEHVCTGASDSIKVEADTGGVVAELNEANNSLTRNWACMIELGPGMIGPAIALKPDLVITDIIYQKTPSRVRFTVKNQGTADSGGFTVKLYTSGVLRDTTTISGGLVAGGQATFTFNDFNLVCVIGSSFPVKVVADTEGTVAESNEGNNSLSEIWGCPPTP